MKQAILFLSDKSSPWIINCFNSIASAGSDMIEVFFIYHERNQTPPKQIQVLNHYTFTSDILHELGYTPIEENLIPGSNHFPLLKFYLTNPQYTFYWMIEDDVFFNGNWGHLFNTYNNSTADFISAFIKKYAESPQWYWWFHLRTDTDEKLPSEKLLCSFNPIYRLSNQALSCIDNALKNGWSGHHEVVLPTLLYNHGFTLIDMGGTGTFVPEGFENHFYMKNTMSHLPMEAGNKPNCLYHPVKEKKVIDFEKLKKKCVISAVGKNSLHREWIKENPDFDLHLIVYDDSYNKYYNDTDFICFQKGYKFKLVYDYLQKNPEYLKRYDYFFLPDDDILMDTKNISKLFQLMEEYHLQIAQPSLSDSYYTHEQTLRDAWCFLRYTNFVEMMSPCFSREALNHVLPTFNANQSGWGIEYHWPELIGFTGQEIAIIDVLYAVHTRPIQSQKLENRIELNQYIKKNHLHPKISETGQILLSTKKIKNSENLITDRETYNYLKKLTNFISYNFLKYTYTFESSPIEIYDLTSISLLLAHYYRISEKRNYLDVALSIAEKSGGSIEYTRKNMNLKESLPIFSWYIEHLAQHDFIENNTEEILEEINEYIDNSQSQETRSINIKDLTALARHYIVGINNSRLKNDMALHYKKKKKLEEILGMINDWSITFTVKESHLDIECMTSYILLLCEAKTVISLPEIDLILRRLVKTLTTYDCNPEKLYLHKTYAILLAAEAMKDYKLKEQTIQNALFFKGYIEDKGFQRILSLYLLHRIYLSTNLEVFKFRALDLLHASIYEDKDKFLRFTQVLQGYPKENAKRMNYLIRTGLIMVSILSEKEIKLDHFIL